MKPYSQDLRARIIQALEAGPETQRAIAERFWVRGSFVEKLWQRWRGSGSRAAQPPASGRQCALTAPLESLRTEMAQHPDAMLAAWRDRLVAPQGPRVRPVTISAPALPATAHKKSLHASERATERVQTRRVS